MRWLIPLQTPLWVTRWHWAHFIQGKPNQREVKSVTQPGRNRAGIYNPAVGGPEPICFILVIYCPSAKCLGIGGLASAYEPGQTPPERGGGFRISQGQVHRPRRTCFLGSLYLPSAGFPGSSLLCSTCCLGSHHFWVVLDFPW